MKVLLWVALAASCFALCGAAGADIAPQADEIESLPPSPPWTTQDVLDHRIDEHAQYALMRMFAKDPVAGAAASAMLSAVKDEALAGIYLPDQQVPALRARDLGKGWWQLLPSGADAICITEPAGKPPLIVFRKEIKSQSYRLDPALRAAWVACRLESAEPRGYRATLPPKVPAVAPPAGQNTRLAVLVVDASRAPVADATVHILVGGAPAGGGSTNSAGMVTLDLDPGIYSLLVEAPSSRGGGSAFLAAQIEPGRTNSYTVQIGAAQAAESAPQRSFPAGALMLPPICAEQAAKCTADCVTRSLDAGKSCELSPECLAREAVRYQACVATCESTALRCAMNEG